MSGTRLDGFGRVDRTETFTVDFEGRPVPAFRGDTVASALLAAGERVVAHSVLLGRPRGIVAAGAEEPSALIQVDLPFPEPMLLATTVEAVPGLGVSTLYGQGRLSRAVDPAAYDAVHHHCDVAIVGAGPAGLAAAVTAGAAGARVLLLDDRPRVGGSLLSDAETRWAATQLDRLRAMPNVVVATRTMVTGYYDDNYLVAVQRRNDHETAELDPTHARQRIWRIRAAEVVLATGAHERPIVFPGNDVPGVMLAEAVRDYLLRYGVLVAHRVVLFTAHDDAYRVAVDLLAAGAQVTVVDARPTDRAGELLPGHLPDRTLFAGAVVVGTETDDLGTLAAVWIRCADGTVESVPCEVLAVSGGWNPAGQLFSQSGGKLRWDADLAAFVPGAATQRVTPAGALRGLRTLAEIVDDGERAGAAAAEAAIGTAAAARRLDVSATVPPLDPPDDGLETYPEPAVLLFSIHDGVGHDGGTDPRSLDASFVDLQRDVTVADLARATGAGLLSVELVKRYTTAGTAHDQGKTSGVLASGVVATLLGVDVSELGTSSYRPPYTPVGFAALAGRERGALYDPVRTTGAHPWHVAHGALFENVGQWKRPWYYPHPGETLDTAVARECTAARTGVAFMDASTLGKIDVQGPDAGVFLDLLYTNLMSNLKVGAIRYGAMCGVDGMIMDDGTVFRLADHHFLVTTTTGNAAKILDWMEEWHQTEWPHLQVWCTSVTEQWATMALVGPRSRELLAVLAPELAVDNDAFPFMTWRSTTVGGLAARVARVSFSGELAYEINVAWTDAAALWDTVWAVGGPIGLTPYGTETMHVLRAEKGYPIIGQDTDGTVTPQDLGMGWVISKKKADYLGKRSHTRADNHRVDRKHLVGLLPDDPRMRLPEGCQLVEYAELPPPPVPMLGHVTSSYDSVELGRTFALALLKGGRDRIGDTVYVVVDGVPQPVTVTSSVLVDPDGTRRDGVEHPPLELRAAAVQAGLPVSPLAGFADRFAALSRRPGTGVRIAEAALTTMINVRVRPGTPAGDAVGAVLGVTLPATTGGRADAGTDTVLALGPDEYLVTSGPGHGAALTARLAAVEGVGAVVDVSAARTMLRISGPLARRVLAHGCAVDLARLTCAQTLLAQCAVILVGDGTPGADDDLVKVLVRSTFAAHLAEWLLLTAREYAG